MDDEEVQKQLDHMVKFIYREAEEKASELAEKAQEEFSIEKSRLVQEEKFKIQKEFERKEKQIEVKKKIAYSNELNTSRLRILRSREEGTQMLCDQAHKQLIVLTEDKASYKKLLQSLILQGLVKLQEPKVTIICRRKDKKSVEEVLQGATEEYKKTVEKPVELDVDNEHFLPSPEETTNAEQACSGGVVLSCHEGRIMCSNTLDARLVMAYEQKLPDIRKTLFGKSLTRVHFD